ncbi:hypothetical protein [Roseivivax isoporae]|uniref:Acyl-CoA transferase n=1 Tax=Roseivivax isoporae LMG 25204 TaxID=1449351 RepID=X7F280_9RHOB|nr:hypothetical protein [Roseivivax isoporae]ETX26853.1 hypothetical protein RISW2_18835 [Roseivivax isoporae LMG 25204]
MPTRHEAITRALVEALAPLAAEVHREADLPEIVPPESLVNVVPEDPEEIEQRLGTGVRDYARAYTLELVVQDPEPAARAAALDALVVAVATALHGQRFGGLVDFLRLSAPQDTDTVPMEGAASLTGAVVTVTAFYETPDNPMETF